MPREGGVQKDRRGCGSKTGSLRTHVYLHGKADASGAIRRWYDRIAPVCVKYAGETTMQSTRYYER